MKQIFSISGLPGNQGSLAQPRRFLARQPGDCPHHPPGAVYCRTWGGGLGDSNGREYISKLDADLIVGRSDTLIAASRLERPGCRPRNVDGVADAGMLGTASATLVLPDAEEPLKVAILGVEQGIPVNRQFWKETSSAPTWRRKPSLTGTLPSAADLRWGIPSPSA